jgi:drug/metabolite transporter (DMT)-like permease
MLFAHELSEHPARSSAITLGIGLTLIGMFGASAANVFQALERVKRFPLFTLLTWAMLFGALIDGAIAFAVAGPPVIETRPGYWFGLVYLALFASALAFSLYLPVVRKIGPGRAAYSSVLVPIIAMGLSTIFEDYRWTTLAIAGGLLAIGGMLLALGGRRRPTLVTAPDAA